MRDTYISYLVEHVDQPMDYAPPDCCRVPRPPRKMSPQMLRLVAILEGHFLGRWCFHKEFRDVLTKISLGRSAMVVFMSRRAVLERAGVLLTKHAPPKKYREFVRPLAENELFFTAYKVSQLRQVQVESVLAQGAFGGMVVELCLGPFKQPCGGIGLYQDLRTFKDFLRDGGCDC